MSNESDIGTRLEEIGGLIVHAEAAQAALDKGLAAHAENVAHITRLIQFGAGVLKKLQVEAEQLGPRAEQAGAGAVRAEVRDSLAGAGAVVGDAARSALRPVLDDAVARIGEAARAGIVLDRQARRFSNQMLALVALSAFGGVALVAFAVWMALAWQRSEVAGLEQEKAGLRSEIAAMESVAQTMRAQGLKIELGDCPAGSGRTRRCVAVQPHLQHWGTEDAPFYVLKGY